MVNSIFDKKKIYYKHFAKIHFFLLCFAKINNTFAEYCVLQKHSNFNQGTEKILCYQFLNIRDENRQMVEI